MIQATTSASPAATSNQSPPALSLEVSAPADGSVIAQLECDSPASVQAKVASARHAQLAWGKLPVQVRAERLRRFRDLLVERSDELVGTLCQETGKPRQEALNFEVLVMADLATWYADNAPKILAPKNVELHLLKYRTSRVLYQPRGVIGVIAPWNFPLVIPGGDVLAALVSGSAVVLKPSEETPLIALKLKEIWDATGFSADLFQVVIGRGDVGAALIGAGIQKLVFTGGVATGRKVAAACGEALIPCVMELGGKAPLIACEDAEVERTARAIVFGGFANLGQICISVERVYAHRRIYGALVRRVRELMSELRQGDSRKEVAELGQIIFGHQIKVAEAHIKDALGKGATLEAGGKAGEGPGLFFEPTLLTGCDHSMTVMTEEIFGPIVPIMCVESEAEALRLANDSHLGLNAYVFSADTEKAQKYAERIEAGSVVINDVFSNYGTETPFGGVKQSGFGRVHGEEALRAMCHTKHISANRFPNMERDPFWFPYSEQAMSVFEKSMRAWFGGGSLRERLGRLL